MTEPLTDLVEELARKAMSQIDVARTGVTNPVNGSSAYSWVRFAGGVMYFNDEEFTYPRTAGTEKAAEQAQRINDLLLDLAKRAASEALTRRDAETWNRAVEAAVGVAESQSDYTTVTPFVHRERMIAAIASLKDQNNA